VVSGSAYLVERRGACCFGTEEEKIMSSRPNPLPRLHRWRTNVIQLPLLTVITAVCGSLSLLVSSQTSRAAHSDRIARFWREQWCGALDVRSPCVG